MGKQKCEDTGPLNIKRMETIDDEVTAGAIKFMNKAVKADKPFFIWWNSSRMHAYTHLSPKWEGKSGLGIYADGMLEHDSDVGLLLAELKKLGIEDNTIVMYSSDNGAEFFTVARRRHDAVPWREEYAMGRRLPGPLTLIRWPGVIKPGTIINDIGAHEDMMPTLLAAAGDSTVKEDLLKGKTIGNMTYKVHLDGYNLMPFFKGDVAESPRHEFIYWTDGGSVAALRYNNWKMTFLRQNSVGFKVWETPFEELRWPMLENLRMDPLSAPMMKHLSYIVSWAGHRMYMLAPAAAYVGAMAAELPRVPATNEARQLQPRPRDGSGNLTP